MPRRRLQKKGPERSGPVALKMEIISTFLFSRPETGNSHFLDSPFCGWLDEGVGAPDGQSRRKDHPSLLSGRRSPHTLFPAAYRLGTAARMVVRQVLTKVRTGNGQSATLSQCRIQYRVRSSILPPGKLAHVSTRNLRLGQSRIQIRAKGLGLAVPR